MSQQLPPDFVFPDPEQTPEPAPRRRIKPGVKTALCTMLVLIMVAVILYAGVLRIRKIAIIGNERVSWNEVVQAAGLENGISFFSVNEEKIREGISSNRYLVYDGMEKQFPNELTIYVHERSPRAYVQVMGVTYLMDEEGMVLERIQGNTLSDGFPVVTGLQAREVRVGRIIVPSAAAQMGTYTNLITELQLQGFLAEISELNLSNPESLYLITRSGYTAHLGDGKDLRAKVGTVRGVIAKLIEMGRYGGMIEASIPEVATYSPVEM